MPEKTGYAQGEPAWVDLATDDVAASKAFYSTLFGWQPDDVPMEDAGGYGMFTLGGRHVGGYAPAQPGRRLGWSVYVAVEDVDKVCEAATAAGGSVVMDPTDVYTSGRMAAVQDPAGAVLSFWQARDHTGTGVRDEANALTWIELSTTDLDGAKAFYGSVLGWGFQDSSDVAGTGYTEFRLGERSVAGMMASQDGTSYWMPYFQPADLDRTVAEATALGATVTVGKMAIPGGDFAILSDPQGAAFGLFRPESATPLDT